MSEMEVRELMTRGAYPFEYEIKRNPSNGNQIEQKAISLIEDKKFSEEDYIRDKAYFEKLRENIR
jgi:hypothetical protein